MKNNNPIWAGAPRSFHFLSKTWFLINNNSISKMVNRVFHCRTGHQMIRNSMLQSKTSVHIYTYLKLSHELIDFFGSIRGTKHNMDFQYPQSVFSFCPKLMYFTDQNGHQGGEHMKINFGYFHIQKIISQTVKRYAKKIESLVQFACNIFKLWSLNYQKMFSFCNFMAIAARNLGLLQQFMHSI